MISYFVCFWHIEPYLKYSQMYLNSLLIHNQYCKSTGWVYIFQRQSVFVGLSFSGCHAKVMLQIKKKDYRKRDVHADDTYST